jgi:agmatinase
MRFDPNGPAPEGSGVFGLPYSEDEAKLVYLPVPWEATTSYGGGTSRGPAAIVAASRQVDLFDLDVQKPYEPGLFMLEESSEVRAFNERAKALAQQVIEAGGDVQGDAELTQALAEVNRLSYAVDDFVARETERLLEAGKIVGVVGGDHSVPFGAIRTVAGRSPIGVLHFDAHSDTRRAYEGFVRSHASIMHNVLEEVEGVTRLVQVGIRDVCEEEVDYLASQGDRVRVFFDRDIARRKLSGEPFAAIAQAVVLALPSDVWVSFDIDGLDPRFCPHTGTPVPGGLDFHEAVFILRALVESGRTIVGFDLNEVAPNLDNPDDEWDANVGARLLYKLSGFTLASRKLVPLRP